MNDDQTLALKARIAPHGNEDSIQNQLHSDCCMCPPTGIRIVLMVAAVMAWPLRKADMKSAFLHTGAAQRDVYVTPRECCDKRFVWRLDTAAYGLVNSNVKWQKMSDDAFREFRPVQRSYMPQLFCYTHYGKKLIMVAATIVDDIIITGIPEPVERLLHALKDRLKPGSVASCPGLLQFYGLNINQNDEYSSMVDADNKLSALETFPLTRGLRHLPDETMTPVERGS